MKFNLFVPQDKDMNAEIYSRTRFSKKKFTFCQNRSEAGRGARKNVESLDGMSVLRAFHTKRELVYKTASLQNRHLRLRVAYC